MRRLVLITLVLLTVLSPAAAFRTAAQDEIPYIEWADCPFLMPDGEVEGDTIECGYLINLADPTNPDGDVVEIAFAIVYSTSDAPAPDPVIYLEGGPGMSPLTSIESWVTWWMRDERDLILVDQRGTGFSLPSLNCPEEETGDEMTGDPSAACFDRLQAEGVAVENFNTPNSASDIAALVETLELDQVNLFGISYGTRLALAVIRDYPDLVRSVMIDSVYPPSVHAYGEDLLTTQSALDRLFETCAADADCDAAYPDLAEVFYALIPELDANPVAYTDYDPETDEEFDSELTGNDLVLKTFEMLYDAEIIPYLPAMIYMIAEGDVTGAVDLAYFGDPNAADEGDDEEYYESEYADYTDEEIDDYFALADSIGDSEGMFNAMECQDEYAYDDMSDSHADEIRPELREDLVAGWEDTILTCELWNVQPSPERESQPVISDIPTLIFAGSLDPVTPPLWGQIAAETLSQGYYFEFLGVGHDVVDSSDCAASIMVAFFDDPTIEPDSSCIAAEDADFSFYIR